MRSAFLLPLLLLSACLLDKSADSGVVEVPTSFSRVVVELTAGDVQLFSGDVDQAAVEWSAEWGTTRPEVEIGLEGDALVIRCQCPDLGLTCNTDVYAVVPAEVVAEIEVFSGTVTVDGLSGAVLTMTTGDAYLREITGSVEASITEGHLEGTDLWADSVVASSGTGRVDLELRAPFSLVQARTTTGPLSVQVPAGGYDLDLDSATGNIQATGVSQSPSAQSRIQARTTTGDLIVSGFGSVI